MIRNTLNINVLEISEGISIIRILIRSQMFTMPYCQMLFLMICWSKLSFLMICWSKLSFKVTKQVLLIYIQIFVKKKKKNLTIYVSNASFKGNMFCCRRFSRRKNIKFAVFYICIFSLWGYTFHQKQIKA